MKNKEVFTYEELKDLYTQSDYARLVGESPQTIRYKVLNRLVNVVEINGAKLIRLRN